MIQAVVANGFVRRVTRLLIGAIRVLFCVILGSETAQGQSSLDSPQLSINPGRFTILSVTNPSSARFTIQSSADLVHWRDVASANDTQLKVEVSVQDGSSVFYRLKDVAGTQSTGPFSITTDHLHAQIGPGVLRWAGGYLNSSPGGDVELRPNATNYIVLNYGTLRFHSLYRFIGDGEQLIATVTTSSNSVLKVEQPTEFVANPSRIQAVKDKLIKGLKIALLGDSLTEASGTGVLWHHLLFSSAYAPQGFNVGYSVEPTVWNFGLGSAQSDYGLALISAAFQSVGNPKQGGNFAGSPGDFSLANSTLGESQSFPLRNESRFWSFMPDLVTVGFGVNGGNYSLNNLESIGRILIEEHQIPTLWLTENDRWGQIGGSQPVASALGLIRDQIGGAIADTAAYVDEVNFNGTNTYVDGVHQNQAGWNAWAEAVSGVLNSRPQNRTNVVVQANRVLSPANASETGALGFSAQFVGGIPLEMTPGCNLTNNAGVWVTNYLPYLFNDCTVVEVPGSRGGVTNWVTYSHHCWNWAALVFEKGVGQHGTAANGYIGCATNSFTGYCSWLDENAVEHYLTSFSYIDDNCMKWGPFQRPGMLDLCSISQTSGSVSNLVHAGIVRPQFAGTWTSAALRITITSGHARVLGVVFGGPRHSDLIQQPAGPEFIPANRWKAYGGPGGTAQAIYTDTLFDPLSLTSFGHGFQLFFRGGSAGGLILAAGDGKDAVMMDLYRYAGGPIILDFLNSTDLEKTNHLKLEVVSTPRNGSPVSTIEHRALLLKTTVFK